MTQEERDWIDIILGLYSNLPLSNGVIRHTDSSDKKRKRIMDYLKKLEEYCKVCISHKYSLFERHYRHIFYYNNYIIKPDDIPNSYYEAKLRIAREKGMGRSEFTDDEKHVFERKIISDQRDSLDQWIDYFIYGNGRFYPIYEQYWAFQGLQKLGKYDKQTGKFSKRNKNTVYPFPYLDEAALEMTITLMEKFVKNKEVVSGLENAFNSYNFKSLYEYSLKKIIEKKSIKSTEGVWRKYDQGSEYEILLNDLRGKHTGWCTERSSLAKQYLEESDFYVYFTKDASGNFVYPRIAIRALGKDIKEIRGIASSQNIETEMIDILNEKLKEFDFGSDYFEKQEAMKKLTIIETKQKNGNDLSREELVFLYEVEGIIEGFGWDRDPRIDEIISKRDKLSDLSIIFGVKKEDIALDISEIKSNTKVFMGDISYFKDGDHFLLDDDAGEIGSIIRDKVIIPKFVVGNVSIHGYSDDIELPELVTKSFYLQCPSVINCLRLPRTGISISIYGLQRTKKIILDENPCHNIYFDNLYEVRNIIFPEVIKGNLSMKCLSFGDDLILPRVVGGDLNLNNLLVAHNFTMPEIIGRNLYIDNLVTFDGKWPTKVYGKIRSYNFSLKQDENKRVIH